jgi:hypothetical protein
LFLKSKLFWYFNSFAAALFAAAAGQPDKLLCVLRFELTCPRPEQPSVGHFKIVSLRANTEYAKDIFIL